MESYQGEIEHHVIVCLADVWLEVPWKKRIPYWWTGKTSAPGLGDYISDAENDTFFEMVSKESERQEPWPSDNQLIHRLHEVDLENYCLLMGFLKVDASA